MNQVLSFILQISSSVSSVSLWLKPFDYVARVNNCRWLT